MWPGVPSSQGNESARGSFSRHPVSSGDNDPVPAISNFANVPLPAGIVLCGGKSSRMGRPKAWLPFGPEVMVQRMVRLLSSVVSPIVVVAAPDQDLPPFGSHVLITRDERDGRGPLEGLLAGMKELSRCGYSSEFAVFATSCDAPLLSPAFVQMVVEHLTTHQAAVPVEDRFFHPLAAAYRLAVMPEIESLLAADQLRPAFLFERVSTCRIPVDALREVDPELHSLKNCNYPDDYKAALTIAGFSYPDSSSKS